MACGLWFADPWFRRLNISPARTFSFEQKQETSIRLFSNIPIILSPSNSRLTNWSLLLSQPPGYPVAAQRAVSRRILQPEQGQMSREKQQGELPHWPSWLLYPCYNLMSCFLYVPLIQVVIFSETFLSRHKFCSGDHYF